MKDNLGMVVDLFSSISEQINPETMPEAKAAMVESAKMLISKAKVAIEQILLSLEKDIKEGKITNQETIQKIREYRDKYNAL